MFGFVWIWYNIDTSEDVNDTVKPFWVNTIYINPGYGLSLVDTLWNACTYRQPLEQEGNPMT